MKKNKKRIRGVIFTLPTFISMILMCALPILFCMVHTKKINNNIFEIFLLGLVIIFVCAVLLGFLETVYCIIHVRDNKKIHSNTKLYWYIILFVLNIFIVPYYYYRYILKDKNLKNKTIIYTLIVLLFSVLSIYTTNKSINIYEKVKEDKILKKLEEKRRKEKIRNTFLAKDNKFEMSFKLGQKKQEVSEYDLYVKDSKKNIVTGAFIYDTSGFQEKTLDAVLNKQIEYIKSSKKNITVYKEKKTRKVDNKTILSTELKGKDDNSSECIYKLSTVSFEGNDKNIIYIIQVVIKNGRKDYIKEIDEIVDSVKLK